MFLNFRCILIQESIQDIRCFAHGAVDDIDPVLFAPVVDVVVERDPTAHPKKAPIVPGVHVGGCHPKANTIGGRGFPVTEERGEGKRSMIGNEMMDRRSQGFFAEVPIVCCLQFMSGDARGVRHGCQTQVCCLRHQHCKQGRKDRRVTRSRGLTAARQVGQIRREVGPTIDLHEHFWESG
jgi:hypothetical protein